MKKTVLLMMVLLLCSCSFSDAERIKQENAALKTQVEALTQERDGLRAQLEAIRAALSTPVDASTAGSTTSDTTSSGSPAGASASSDSATAAANPEPGTGAAAPASGTNGSETAMAESGSVGATPTVPSSPEAPATAASGPAFEYALSVLAAATAFKATGQNPPTECSLGYTAGSSGVGRSPAVKRCEVKADGNQVRVRVETLDGSVINAP